MNREQFLKDYSALDPGIAGAVEILMANGVETFESCEGGQGHSFPDPTIRFYVTCGAIWQAVNVCLLYGLSISEARLSWDILEGHPTGPYGIVVFRNKEPLREAAALRGEPSTAPTSQGVRTRAEQKAADALMTDDEYELRKFIAIAHQDGKCHIYGDDGELQCSNMLRHGRIVDFRREPIGDLLKVIYTTRLREYAALRSPEPPQGEVGK